MFDAASQTVASAAVAKNNLMKKNPVGFLLSSMAAGAFVSFGSFVSTTMAFLANNAGCTVTKLIQAFLFSSALCLVIISGGELFTGNNLTMCTGALAKKITWKDVIIAWIFCWLGNLLGSWLMVILYHLSGADVSPVSLFASLSQAKIALTPVQMIVRGILCNICVCLGVWCAARTQNDAAKIMMSVFCIFIFMICGFEHSVANMSTIGVALINRVDGVTWLGYGKNLFWVTIGNILGGSVFLSLPYYLMGKEERA